MSAPLDIYEGCQRFMCVKDPAVLDDMLEITFTHVPTQKLLKRMRFYITATKLQQTGSEGTRRLAVGAGL